MAMKLQTIASILMFTYFTLAAPVCYYNEKCFYGNKGGEFCCTKTSCRKYKGSPLEDFSGCVPNNRLRISSCEATSTNCIIASAFPNIFFPRDRVPFTCKKVADCYNISDTAEEDYCCRNQFCRFTIDECKLEPIVWDVSKRLFDALLSVAVIVFAANLGTNIFLIYKLCVIDAKPKTTSYVVHKDENPGLNIFLPAQYEGGQGMTTDGKVINEELKPRSRKMYERQELPTQSQNMITSDNITDIQNQEANPYFEGELTQDHTSGIPNPEELNGDLDAAQFQQREDLVGMPLGQDEMQNMDQNYQNDMAYDDNMQPVQDIQDEYIDPNMMQEDPMGVPNIEDYNNGSINDSPYN